MAGSLSKKFAKAAEDGTEVKGPDDLTFGGYCRLLERSELWEKLELKIDRKELIGRLERVRSIRNDVMHFSPDGIESADVHALGPNGKIPSPTCKNPVVSLKIRFNGNQRLGKMIVAACAKVEKRSQVPEDARTGCLADIFFGCSRELRSGTHSENLLFSKRVSANAWRVDEVVLSGGVRIGGIIVGQLVCRLFTRHSHPCPSL